MTADWLESIPPWVIIVIIGGLLAWIGWHLATDSDDAAAMYGRPEDAEDDTATDTAGGSDGARSEAAAVSEDAAVAELRHLERISYLNRHRDELIRQSIKTGHPPLRAVEEILDLADEAERQSPAIRGPFTRRMDA